MNREPLKHFLRLLGVGQIKDLGEWVSSECPLARWTHKSRADRHPSFGVRINSKGASVYKCYSCKQKAAPLESLLFIMSRYRGSYYREATDFLIKHEIFNEDYKQVFSYQDKWESPKEKKKPKLLPKEAIEQYARLSDFSVPKEVKDFIHARRITLAICDYYDVRWSKEFKSLIFPSVWSNGITSIKARRMDQKKFFFLSGGLYLFGLNRIDCSKPVWLVEGEFDMLRLNNLGEYNVVSLGGSNIPTELPNYIHTHTLISGFDNDGPGKEATKKLHSMFGGYYHIKTADWGVCGCKDAGEIKTLDQFKEVKRFLS